MSIKYYRLAKDEELPEEFCVVRDVGGEPSEYVFYVPESENAKLREERNHWKVEQTHAYSNWEDAHKRVAELEVENTELRELCKMFVEYVNQDRCEGCVVKRRCNDGEVEECWQLAEIRKMASELRIEVE